MEKDRWDKRIQVWRSKDRIHVPKDGEGGRGKKRLRVTKDKEDRWSLGWRRTDWVEEL
jgi:hypothetical protein